MKSETVKPEFIEYVPREFFQRGKYLRVGAKMFLLLEKVTSDFPTGLDALEIREMIDRTLDTLLPEGLTHDRSKGAYIIVLGWHPDTPDHLEIQVQCFILGWEPPVILPPGQIAVSEARIREVLQDINALPDWIIEDVISKLRKDPQGDRR